jgi:Lactate racemase N-terminal domain
MPLPPMVRLRQSFPRPRVDDVGAAVHAALAKLDLSAIKPGQTVALTAGSRGIANIPKILRGVVEHLKDLKAKPFLVPAMGSHGGGTAAGQQALIESYGITESFVGAPIRASMDVVEIGKTPEGWPVYLDKIASTADHIGVVARVKPHTSYHGAIESGWMKMMMIGLGKREGAAWYHRVLLENDYVPVVRSVGKVVRAKAPIAFGVATVENAYDETALIDAALPADFEPVEERLLAKSKEWLAKLPFGQADMLIIDEIGKEISGSGMDTNIVGRKRAFKGGGPANQPQMRFIFVRELSKHTHGNGTAIGLADFTTTRFVKALDYAATRLNCVTSGYPEGANLPVHFDSDHEVLAASLSILGTRDPALARIMRIRNTMHVEEVHVSQPCLDELSPQSKFEVLGPVEWTFDAAGNLPAIPIPGH